MHELVLENISTYYGKNPVLHNLTLRFHEGTIVGIIGPNGAGKSTLGRVIAGLKETHGRVIWTETSITSSQSKTVTPELVSYLFQNPNVTLFAKTILDEFKIGINIPSDKLEAILTIFGLLKYKDHHPRSLSRGEKQRLCLALAVARQNQILVLDEPFSGVDSSQKQRLLSYLIQLKNEGKTIILISHDLSLLLDHCDRVIGLVEGRVRFDGQPKDLLVGSFLSDLDFRMPLFYFLLHQYQGTTIPSSIALEKDWKEWLLLQ